MRRKQFTILFALPAANALSLANFQLITSVTIPLSCQLTYDSQIPTCTKSDFVNGCSAACVAELKSVAQDVSDSCAQVSVSSSTLLGIVKNGGIVAALCPTLSTSTTLKSTTPIAVSSAAPAVSVVTIPTNSQGVTGGLGFKTTSTSSISTSTSLKTSSIPAPQSAVTTSRSSSVVSVTISSTSSTTTSTSSIESADGGLGGETSTSTTISSTSSTSTSTTSKKGSVATSTSSSTPKPASQPDNVSGGGSPFDIASSANRIGGDSILGLVILVVMMCVLTGR